MNFSSINIFIYFFNLARKPLTTVFLKETIFINLSRGKKKLFSLYSFNWPLTLRNKKKRKKKMELLLDNNNSDKPII